MANLLKRDQVPFAFLPINKPAGPTSHDVVAAVRRLLPRKLKVGHTGTLDPFAEGLMLLAIGKATRFSDEVHLLDKRYEGIIKLGQETNTLDPTGDVVLEKEVPQIRMEQLAEIAKRWTGEIEQVPPAFSSKKVAGVRSYKLARKDQAVELPPQKVSIHELILSHVDDQRIHINVRCSTGTYVRSLARDLAVELGTCGHLETLVRQAVGHVELNRSLQLSALSSESLIAHHWKVGDVLSQYPEIPLPLEAYSDLANGRIYATREPLPASFIGSISRNDDVRALFKCTFQAGIGITSKLVCYQSVPDSV